MIEIVEMLRLWLQGLGLREVARLSGTDRKTVRRYVDRARACGLDRDGGDSQLTDELLAAVIAEVRPHRPTGKSLAWETIAAEHEQIKAWLKDGLTLTKIHTLLGRRGVVVSYRTLHRYATTELGFGRRQATVPVADCEPGAEVQVDFGRLGLLIDAGDGRRRVVHGLIFTAVYSRHMFVWPTYRQTLNDVIAGFEAAWVFFGGVFAVVIPDNMKAIVTTAHATEPRLNDAFREYAQARGFAVDPTRVRSPKGVGRDHHRALQERMHPRRFTVSPRPAAHLVRCRADHRRLHRLVQPEPSHAPPWPCPTHRGRSPLLFRTRDRPTGRLTEPRGCMKLGWFTKWRFP